MTSVPYDLQRLLAEEPFVRRLAQQLVRGEADDVVQQTWLRVLATRPRSLREPRHWLASIVRRLVADHDRGERRRRERERAAGGTGEPVVPSSSDLLDGEERRRELIAAVDALPAPLRTVVLLRWYDGEPPRRIAARLGVPVTTVSNRLHTALQELRRKLDARHGERRTWLLPLVPFAAKPRELPWRELSMTHAALAAGAIVTTKTKLGVLAAALVAVVVWSSWPAPRDVGVLHPDDAAPPRASIAVAGDAKPCTDDASPAADATRALVATPDVATTNGATGSVLVHVRCPDDPRAVAGVVTRLGRGGHLDRAGSMTIATDANGDARFDGVAPGRVGVRVALNPTRGAFGVVEAGATTELTIDRSGGITITGVVVDPLGTPVASAELEVSMPAMALDPGLPGVTSTDGTFTLRGCNPLFVIGARAAGFAASAMYFGNSRPGATEHVRIELQPAGGVVTGHVLDTAGRPIADAAVQIGDGSREGIMVTPQGAPPLPAAAVTDAEGRFRAVGVPRGPQRVQAMAAGFAPWSGTCDVVAGATAAVRIVLTAGLTCRGVVRNEDGEPLPDIRVAFGDFPDFARLAATSGADGAFVLTGLPPECTLIAAHRGFGKGAATIRGDAGGEVACELVLTNGVVLRGRIVDDAGTPVPNVSIDIEGAAIGGPVSYGSMASSDGAGRFRIANVPADHRLALRVATRDFAPLDRRDVDPTSGEIELRLQRYTGARAHITGRVTRLDGTPAGGERISAARTDVRAPTEHARIAADGSFGFDVWPGTWQVWVDSPKHPTLDAGPRTLQAGANWDIGPLQLTRGGSLVVPGDAAPGARWLVVEPDGSFVGIVDSPLPPARTDPLNPGAYRLLVHGDGIAATAVPFTIRDGEDTTLVVKPTAGVRQRFELRAAAGSELPRFAKLRIDRAGELVALVETGMHDGSGVLPAIACLAPGIYTLHVVHGATAASETFQVGAAEGDVVRVTVR